MKVKTVAAGAFKQGCLALLDEVAQGRAEIVVTKRGRPVARVVCIDSDRERERTALARLRGQTRILADDDSLMEPSSKITRWRGLGSRRRGR